MNKVIIDGKINCITDDNKKYIKFGLTNKHNSLSIYPSFNIERTLYNKNKDLFISEEILDFKNHVNRLEEIDNLLANVKVADLAVGSGAFPLGMLNEIVKARQVLTEYF